MVVVGEVEGGCAWENEVAGADGAGERGWTRLCADGVEVGQEDGWLENKQSRVIPGGLIGFEDSRIRGSKLMTAVCCSRSAQRLPTEHDKKERRIRKTTRLRLRSQFSGGKK
jgi:hypothetical protein